ncbi:hypothetical protein FRC17_007924 [Serendipita sp. 399]|nr:hypothetical protein FRC17_007924 [Serendipita sp. 399]
MKSLTPLSGTNSSQTSPDAGSATDASTHSNSRKRTNESIFTFPNAAQRLDIESASSGSIDERRSTSPFESEGSLTSPSGLIGPSRTSRLPAFDASDYFRQLAASLSSSKPSASRKHPEHANSDIHLSRRTRDNKLTHTATRVGVIGIGDTVGATPVTASEERESAEAVPNLGRTVLGGRTRGRILAQRALSSIDELVATTPRRRKRNSDHLENVSEREVESESKVTKRARLEDGLHVHWSPRLGREQESSAETADQLECIGIFWEKTGSTGAPESTCAFDYSTLLPGSDNSQTSYNSLPCLNTEVDEGNLMKETVDDPASSGEKYMENLYCVVMVPLDVADLDDLISPDDGMQLHETATTTANLADIEGIASIATRFDTDDASSGGLDAPYVTSSPSSDSASVSSDSQMSESTQEFVALPRTTRATRQQRRLPTWAELLAYCGDSQELKRSLESQTSILESNAEVFTRQEETEVRNSLFNANGEPKRSEVAGVKAYSFLPENQLPVILDGREEVAAFAAKEMGCNYVLVCRASFSIDATDKTFSYQTSPCKKVLKTDENLVRHIREQHLGIKRQRLGR